MKAVKYGVCAIALALVAVLAWTANQPDTATQDYIEQMEQIGRE